MSRSSTLLAAVAILLALNLLFTIVGRISGEAWTYAIIAPTDEKLDSELNKAGLMGHDVVSARRAGNADSRTFSYELILKRRLGLIESIEHKFAAAK